MKAGLREWIRLRQFARTRAGASVNPFFLARRLMWQEIGRVAPALRGRVLDVGCGTKPYRNLFDASEYVGLEIDSPQARSRGLADVYYDGSRFPFNDARFDVVICNQVLEHVFEPDRFLQEIQRLLKPQGRLLLTVPFV
jgi:SAM-dependent methyltransferase